MAQEQVEVRGVRRPPDVQWIEMQTTNNAEVQSLGEFAVNEQNQKPDGGNLKFVEVHKAWEMSLAPDAGHLYLLHLIVTGPDAQHGAPAMFEAFVWKTAGGPRLFMSCRMRSIIGCHIL